MSPLGGMDAAELRGAGPCPAPPREGGRAGRGPPGPAERRAGPGGAARPPSSLDGLATDRAVDKARRLGALLQRARHLLDARRERGGGAVDALVGHPLAGPAALGGHLRRFRRRRRASRPRRGVRALRGGGARRRSSAATPARRASSRHCSAQQIPADTLADRGVRGEAVRLLTAHRSKGLEWLVVVVPRCRRAAGPTCAAGRPCCAPTSRRRAGRPALAAAGRARAPCSPRSAGSSTSPAPAPGSGCWSPPWRRPTTTATSRRGSPTSSASSRGAVPGTAAAGRSRSTVWSPTSDGPRPTRDGAGGAPGRRRPPAGRLARQRHGEAPLVPAADPATWWGTRARSRSERPVRPVERARRPSVPAPSTRCWPALPSGSSSARHVRGASPPPPRASATSSTASPTGWSRATSATRSTVDELMDHVDRVWGQLPFRTPWSSVKDRERDPRRPRVVPRLAPSPRTRGRFSPPRSASRRR